MATLFTELRGALKVSIWYFVFNKILGAILLNPLQKHQREVYTELQEQTPLSRKGLPEVN